MSPGPEDLLSQREKREVLENDRRIRERGTTFSTFAEAFADEERGGRYAAVNKTNVIGTQAAPQYPEGPAWCAGDQGLEASLGVDINAMQPTGEAHEVERSIQQLGEAGFPAGQPDGGDAQRSGTEVNLTPDAVSQTQPSPPASTTDTDDEPPRAA